MLGNRLWNRLTGCGAGGAVAIRRGQRSGQPFRVDLKPLYADKQPVTLEREMRVTDEFVEGYLDGRKPNNSIPSANRSHGYLHSFAIGRAALSDRPIHAEVSANTPTLVLSRL